MLHAEQHSEHVGIESGRVAFGGLFRHGTGAALGPGVVDGHIEPAESCHGLVDQVADIVFVADISTDEFGFHTETAELLGQRMARLVAAAGHNDPGAFLSEGQGRGTADTGQGACNQDDGCTHGRSPLKADCIDRGDFRTTWRPERDEHARARVMRPRWT